MGGLTLVIAPHAFTNDPCPCGHALEESDESEWTCSRGHKFRRWGWLDTIDDYYLPRFTDWQAY